LLQKNLKAHQVFATEWPSPDLPLNFLCSETKTKRDGRGGLQTWRS